MSRVHRIIELLGRAEAIFFWMSLFPFQKRSRFFFSPEYGGDVVSGGGHPADSPVPPSEPIEDAFGQDERGRGKTPGVGVPGTPTNPVGEMKQEVARRAHELWEEAGKPEGRSDEFWLRAEAELQRRSS